MSELKASELKVFLPAKDFEQSKQFYCDLGFTLQWISGDGSLAYFQIGPAKFLLQNYFSRDAAEHLMMHLLVPDVDAWYQHIRQQDLVAKYAAVVGSPEDRPWGIRDFPLQDPSGVLWRIGQAL